MNRRHQIRFAALGVMLCLLISSAYAQQGGKKQYTFRGKVTAVNADTKNLTVANEKIEGWMDAMTMAYKVDKDDVFKRVKAGDEITAKVYDGDYSLHEVEVVPPKADKAPAKK